MNRILFLTLFIVTACSVAETDIDTRAHQPCIASCGLPLIFAAVTSRAALAAARPRSEIFAQHALATGIHLYVETASPVADIEARKRPAAGQPEAFPVGLHSVPPLSSNASRAGK